MPLPGAAAASTWSATAAPPASATAARCRSRRRQARRRSDDLVVAAVLCGNRNFEGRINPQVRANYLASPPLVVAYALAGTVDIDLTTEPLGHRHGRQAGVSCATSGRPHDEVAGGDARLASTPEHVPAPSTRAIFDGDERWRELPVPHGRAVRLGRRVHLRRRSRRSSRACEPEPSVADIDGARVLALLGDSVTTDHISPAGSIPARQPGGQVPDRARRRAARLQLLRRAARQPRGDGARHVRQHPPAQPAGRPARGRLDACTCPTASRCRSTTPRCATAEEGVPLIVIGGQGVRLRLVARLGGQGQRCCSASAR